MSLTPSFRVSLERALSTRGVAVSQWRGGTRVSNHLLEMSTSPQPTVLYIKGSTSDPGFWGLTHNQLDCLCHSKARWFCVFLHRSSMAGYLLSGGQIQLRLQKGDLTLGKDGDYKVNERSELVSSQRFEGVAALLSRLL